MTIGYHRQLLYIFPKSLKFFIVLYYLNYSIRFVLFIACLWIVPSYAAPQTKAIAKITETRGGVFAMQAFNKQLYIGMFGYGNAPDKGMLYRYDSSIGKTEEIKGLSQSDLGKAESICALQEFKGQLYAATEEKGRFFRSANGSDWDLVHTGNYPISCSLEVHHNVLYASNASHASPDQQGEILYTDSGDKGSWNIAHIEGFPGYIRELVSHQNKLYGFSVYNGTGRWLTSDNGKYWQNKPSQELFGSNIRVFRSQSIDDTLWLGTAQYGVDNGTTGIWALTESGLTNQYTTERYSHITGFETGYLKDSEKPILMATASSGFKNRGLDNGSAVLKSSDNGISWEESSRFPEEEGIWAIARYQEKLYVATMHGGLPNYSNAYGRILELKKLNTYPIKRKSWISTLMAKFSSKH